MKVLHYDKKFCKIYYIETLKCVHLEWDGFAASEEFRDACNASLELLIKEGADKMIADNTKAKVVKNEDQQWMNEVWFPKAFGAGFRTSAVVVAKDIFRDMSVKKIVNDLDKNKFTVQFFPTYAEAETWIKEVEETRANEKVV